MPTTSSYYSDLQYPTVNQDGSIWGGITNTYLDEVLKKIKALSDRVTVAQGQLGNINRGTNAVDNLNSTLSSLIGTNALLPGTGTTLLPDPYSGTYTKTTSWPAYTSELSSYSPPTTQAEVTAFDYQNFANVLSNSSNTGVLDLIESKVTQAEQDILAAQKDTCRTKKYIDAYNARTTTTSLVFLNNVTRNGQIVFTGDFLNLGGTDFRIFSSNQVLFWSASSTNASITQYSLAGSHTLHGQNTAPARSSPGLMDIEVNFSGVNWPTVSNSGTTGNNFGMNTTTGTLTIYSSPVYYSSQNSFYYQAMVTLPSGYAFSTTGLSLNTADGTTSSGSNPYYSPDLDAGVNLVAVSTENATTTSTPTADLSSCENPSPPYFI